MTGTQDWNRQVDADRAEPSGIWVVNRNWAVMKPWVQLFDESGMKPTPAGSPKPDCWQVTETCY
jgi:hypothetical protein